MKVYVYTIAKDEEKNAASFMENMKEADGVYILDTGSTDGTVALLRTLGAAVKRKTYKTFRFDRARNDALAMVPEEQSVCVCPDLDERFEPGWRQKLESAWHEKATRARYKYVWSINPDGSDGVSFITDKLHSRFDYKWIHPVHETLSYTGTTMEIFADTPLVLRHYPDASKSRASYLPLLELAVRENPDDDRSAHYLGREYMFYKRYPEAIAQLKRHLSLKSAVWRDERCASYRYIAKCCAALDDDAGRLENLLRAAAEAPHLREPLFELGEYYHEKAEWFGVLHFMGKAVSLDRRESYITDPKCYGALPYDYLSVAAYNSGLYASALEWGKKAFELSGDERIKGNIEFFKRQSDNAMHNS